MYKLKYFLLLTLLLIAVRVSYAETGPPEEIAKLVKQCGACHGMDGNSTINTIPSFAGINQDYFKFAMDAYKNGNRKSDVMLQFTANITAEEFERLAKYYAQQTYRPGEQNFNERLAKKGKVIHETYCAKCHDNSGYPGPYSFGILAGQWMPYIRLTLKEYLDGTRKTNPIMFAKLKRMQNAVGEEGIEQLVHFYVSVKK